MCPLIYGKLIEQTTQTKSCGFIGYPWEQNGAHDHDRSGLPDGSRKKMVSWMPCSKSFTDQACSVKMDRYWPHFFFFFFNINSGFLVISLHSTVVISIYSIKQLGRTKRELFRNRRDRFIKYRFWNFEVTINFGFSMGAGKSVWYNSIS